MVEATTLFKPVKKAREIYFFLAKTLRNLAINDLTRVRLRDIRMSRSMNLTIAEGNKHKYLQPMTLFLSHCQVRVLKKRTEKENKDTYRFDNKRKTKI